MTCDQLRRALSADRLSPAGDGHLRDCAECRGWSARLAQVRQGAGVLVPAAPAGLAERVLGGLDLAERPVSAASAATSHAAPVSPPGQESNVIRPRFWGTVGRKVVASAAAACLVLAGIVVTVRPSDPDPEMVLTSAVEAFEAAPAYEFVVEGQSSARFAPPGLPAPPVRSYRPPQPPTPQLAPPPPPAPRSAPPPRPAPEGRGDYGVGGGFEAGMGGMLEGLGNLGLQIEAEISAGMAGLEAELRAIQAELRSEMEAFQRELQAAASAHQAEFEQYVRELEAELAGFRAELGAELQALVGADLDYLPPEFSILYRAEGTGEGRDHMHARMGYEVTTPISARTEVEVVEAGGETYVREGDASGAAGWLRLDPALQFSLPGLPELTGVGVIVGLIDRREGEVSDEGSREMGSTTVHGYGFMVAGMWVTAWIGQEDGLPYMIKIDADRGGVALQRDRGLELRLLGYGQGIRPQAPEFSVPSVDAPALPRAGVRARAEAEATG